MINILSETLFECFLIVFVKKFLTFKNQLNKKKEYKLALY